MKQIFLIILLIPFIRLYSQTQGVPTLGSLMTIKDTIALKKQLKELEKGPEASLEELLMYYNIRDNNAQRDSIVRLAERRFPAGTIAFRSAQSKIRNEQDEGSRSILYAEAIQKFPGADFSILNTALANDLLNRKQVGNAMPYIRSVRQPDRIVALAEKLLLADVDSATALVKEQLEARSGDTAFSQSYLDLQSLYCNILIKVGKEEAALPYAEKVYIKSRKKNEEQVKTYVSLLLKQHKETAAILVLENSVLKGQADSGMLQTLRTCYSRSANPDSLMAALDQKYHAKIKEDVARMMENKPSPSFSVIDTNGHSVSWNDLKGKVVVIDFWATWCVPCKRSFPAMKMALQKYEKDPDVKFLFIHTLDEKNSTALQEAQAYLADNQFPFHLYMDYRDPVTHQSPVATAFEVQAIPTKLVIDVSGNIRFTVVGFSGNNIETVEELSTMIEMSKKR